LSLVAEGGGEKVVARIIWMRATRPARLATLFFPDEAQMLRCSDAQIRVEQDLEERRVGLVHRAVAVDVTGAGRATRAKQLPQGLEVALVDDEVAVDVTGRCRGPPPGSRAREANLPANAWAVATVIRSLDWAVCRGY
jgi:hypothetical protein